MNKEIYEAECYNKGWEDWFLTGHEYGVRDEK